MKLRDLEEDELMKLKQEVVQLSSLGLRRRTIGDRLGLSYNQVVGILDEFQMSPESFFDITDIETIEDMKTAIFKASPEALKTIYGLMLRSRKDEVKLKAATDIMDRAGFKPVERTMNVHAIEEMSLQELKDGFNTLLSRARERKRMREEVDEPSIVQTSPQNANPALASSVSQPEGGAV